jgi:hypothetical protein
LPRATFVLALGFLLASGCSARTLSTVPQPSHADYSQRSQEDFVARNISPEITGKERSLIRSALLLHAKDLMQRNVQKFDEFLVIKSEHGDTVYVNRPELRGVLEELRPLSLGSNVYANAGRQMVLPVAGPLSGCSGNCTGPFRETLSQVGFQLPGVVANLPCSNSINTSSPYGDTGYFYTGGFDN